MDTVAFPVAVAAVVVLDVAAGVVEAVADVPELAPAALDVAGVLVAEPDDVAAAAGVLEADAVVLFSAEVTSLAVRK